MRYASTPRQTLLVGACPKMHGQAMSQLHTSNQSPATCHWVFLPSLPPRFYQRTRYSLVSFIGSTEIDVHEPGSVNVGRLNPDGKKVSTSRLQPAEAEILAGLRPLLCC